jgi:hypothetical protein
MPRAVGLIGFNTGSVILIVLTTGRQHVPLFHVGDNSFGARWMQFALAAGIFVAAPKVRVVPVHLFTGS